MLRQDIRPPRPHPPRVPHGDIQVHASYVFGAPEPVYSVLHLPHRPAASAGLVVICSPFGYDEIASYRSLRMIAFDLAAAGFACVRFSLPGTGDSGGSPRDPERWRSWTGAVDLVARWGAQRVQPARITAFGVGLGGLVAYAAIAAEAPIDDFVLWGTPRSGRALLRELKATSRLEASRATMSFRPPPAPSGWLEVGGFLVTPEVQNALAALDLGQLELPRARDRRVLLLDRDGIPTASGAADHLRASGAEVTVAPGQGYALMTEEPNTSRPPEEVMSTLKRWLSQRPSPSVTSAEGSISGRDGLVTDGPEWEPASGDEPVVETLVEIPTFAGDLPGVLNRGTARDPDFTILLLNPGTVRRIGLGRMWVEAARRWAAWGVPVLRFDLEAIGDAPGEAAPYANFSDLYSPTFVDQVVAIMDKLDRRGLGPRYMLCGLSSSAYYAFQGALVDDRVRAALMINPVVFMSREELEVGTPPSRRTLPSVPRQLEGGLAHFLRMSLRALRRLRAWSTRRLMA